MEISPSLVILFNKSSVMFHFKANWVRQVILASSRASYSVLILMMAYNCTCFHVVWSFLWDKSYEELKAINNLTLTCRCAGFFFNYMTGGRKELVKVWRKTCQNQKLYGILNYRNHVIKFPIAFNWVGWMLKVLSIRHD